MALDPATIIKQAPQPDSSKLKQTLEGFSPISPNRNDNSLNPFPTAMSVLGAPGNDHLMKMLSKLDRATSYKILEEFENNM